MVIIRLFLRTIHMPTQWVSRLSYVEEMNLKLVRAGFHGNHPAYSTWITNELNKTMEKESRLTPQSVNEIITEAKIEIENAYKNYKLTGENMNTYFKKLNGNGF